MRKLTAIAAIAALFSTACSSSEAILSTNPAEAAVSSQFGQTFDLRPGQTARVGSEGLLVGFRGVTSDSRCPTDVQCVWAGDATLRIPVTVGNSDWTSLELHTGVDPRSATFRNWKITVMDLKPAPRSTARIDSNNYIVTLKVE